MKNKLSRASIALLLVFSVFACSQGGGETGTGYNGSPTTTQGVITGFGSVYVNGVHYLTGSASVLDDDQSTTVDFLKVGMVVTLQGDFDSNLSYGNATSIRYEKDIQGKVSNLTSNSFQVLGQTVTINADTVFNSQLSTTAITFASIKNDDIVEVSGYNDGTGNITATLIEVEDPAKPENTVQELKGWISGLIVSSSATTFSLGSQSIDATSAKYNNMTTADLKNGLQVRVSAQTYSGGVFKADSVSLIQDATTQAATNENVEVKGVVTTNADSSTGTTQFSVNGKEFTVSDTVLQNSGITSSDIQSGKLLNVHAVVSDNNKLVVTEISGQQTSDLEAEGTIATIDYTNNTMTLTKSTVDEKGGTVDGYTLSISASAVLKDDAETSDRYFSFNSLTKNDQVDVSYYIDTTTGNYIVTKLERKQLALTTSGSSPTADSKGSADGGDTTSASTSESNTADNNTSDSGSTSAGSSGTESNTESSGIETNTGISSGAESSTESSGTATNSGSSGTESSTESSGTTTNSGSSSATESSTESGGTATNTGSSSATESSTESSGTATNTGSSSATETSTGSSGTSNSEGTATPETNQSTPETTQSTSEITPSTSPETTPGTPDNSQTTQDNTDPTDSTSTELNVSGSITNLNTTAKTFQINGQTIDYSNISNITGLADGIQAEVQGTTTNGISYASEINLDLGQ